MSGSRSSGGEAPPAERRGRWVLAGNLTATMAVGPIPVFAVGALAPLLTSEFDLTRTELGVLTPVAFGVAAIGGYAGGHLPDRLGPRRILIALYTCALIAFVGFAAAPTFVALIVALLFAGLAMSLSNPVTNALVGRQLPPGERGVVMGLKQSGVTMGQFLAGTTLPLGALVWGWRGVLIAGAALPLAGILISWRTLPPDSQPVERRVARKVGDLDPVVWILSLYSFLIAVVLQATGVYASLYAFEEVAVSSAVAGTVVGVFGVVGIAARITWGRIAEGRRTVSGPLTLLAGLTGLSMVGFLTAQHVGGWLLWVSAVMFGASAAAVNVVAMLGTFRIASPETTGRATGIIVLGMYSGFVVGPATFGMVTDAVGSYAVGWTCAATLCVVAMGVAQWLRHRGA